VKQGWFGEKHSTLFKYSEALSALDSHGSRGPCGFKVIGLRSCWIVTVIVFTFLLRVGAVPAQRLGTKRATITYLANEGVMIECDGQKILIDALFRDSVENYVRYTPDQQESIETGKAPFDGIRLALATHYHLDHWDAGAISRFLSNSPQAVFASTPEATAMLPHEFRGRVKALRPKPGVPAHLSVGGATVEAFRLGHDHTPNFGYRISICGKTFAHLGDADDSDASFRTLTQIGPVDVAMVPFWWFLNPAAADFLMQRWKPKRMMAFHLGANDAAYAEQLHEKFPHVWICTTSREAHNF
jgi:L-ascorbate metabolism protein UlaG (beta-lactamase superfamily)